MAQLNLDDINRLRTQLESWGEAKVRELLTEERFGKGDAAGRYFVEDWLREKETAREAETLSIARQALSNSRRANIIAIIAMILSATATIIAAYIGLSSKP